MDVESSIERLFFETAKSDRQEAPLMALKKLKGGPCQTAGNSLTAAAKLHKPREEFLGNPNSRDAVVNLAIEQFIIFFFKWFTKAINATLTH
jgi:hypothetical protein